MGSMKDLLGDEPYKYPDVPGHEKGSNTSKDAALSVKEGAAAMRARVKAHVGACGAYGAISDEAEDVLNMPHQTCSARFTELVKKGELVKLEKTRNTKRGHPARVHVLPDFGV